MEDPDYTELKKAVIELQDRVTGLEALLKNVEGFNFDNYEGLKLATYLLREVWIVLSGMHDMAQVRAAIARRIELPDDMEATIKRLEKLLDRSRGGKI
jgi:hypothetical protein